VTDDAALPTLPAWVSKRDGRLVPFDADKISRSLFAATERLGRPDAFMARELTDGILHFLRGDSDNAIPTTTQLTEFVIKVVRELGQPALAQSFADGVRQREEERQRVVTLPRRREPTFQQASSPALGPQLHELGRWVDDGFLPAEVIRKAGQTCLRDYALREVFARDLVSAHRDGLLTLTGLENPLALAVHAIGAARVKRGSILAAIEEVCSLTGRVLAWDGPEYVIGPALKEGDFSSAGFLQQLGVGLRAAGLSAVLNVNCASPPDWAHKLAEGPLFPEPARVFSRQTMTPHAEALLAAWETGNETQLVRIDWHLEERDFAPEAKTIFLHAVRRAAEATNLAFVFDRPRRPLALAEGLDRRHTGTLLTVGVHLPRLLQQSGVGSDSGRFLHKLESLARLALSAGIQKRDFLRRLSNARPELGRGFRLDRARLAVTPVGLEEVTRRLFDSGLCEKGAGLEFAKEIVVRLRNILRDDGRSSRLETCVDSASDFMIEDAPQMPCVGDIAGLTAWNAEATLKDQLDAAGLLHREAEAGTAAILLPSRRSLSPDEVIDSLRYAWKHTDVVRVRFIRAVPQARQLTAPWETGAFGP
jgi:hypothetical protein